MGAETQNEFNKERFEKFKNVDPLGSLAYPHRARIGYVLKIFQDEVQNTAKKYNVLDVGCADGFISQDFKRSNTTVFGLDTSRHNINEAKKKGIIAKVGSIENKLQFKKEFFNVVFMGELIEHLFDPDFALTESNRVLASGGVVILTFPNLASLPNRVRLLQGKPLMHFDVSLQERHGGHIRGFTPISIQTMLKNHDFNTEHIYGSSVSLNPYKRTNSPFGVFLGRLFPHLGDLLVVSGRKVVSS